MPASQPHVHVEPERPLTTQLHPELSLRRSSCPSALPSVLASGADAASS
jgi:hypothetical protein